MPYTIAPVRHEHAVEVARIYDHHVLHGTGTFEEVPPGAEEMSRRIAGITGRGWPWLVAAGEKGLLGYAYAGQYRERTGYRYTCEDAVYVAPDAIGLGVGSALLSALIRSAQDAGFHQMLAAIGDASNAASVALHRRYDFLKVGTLKAVGLKFGRPLDVVFMQRSLERRPPD